MTQGIGPTEWSLRVRAGGEAEATAFVRGASLPIGVPLSFDPDYSHATALETLLAAVGGDLVAGLGQAAKRRRVALDHVEALVRGELDNPLTHLAVRGEAGHPGLRRIAVKLFVESVAGREEIEALLAECLERSPLAHTFRRCIEFEVELAIT